METPTAQPPIVQTRLVTVINTFSAVVTAYAYVINDDGGAITRRGLVWAKTPDPSLERVGNDYKLAGTGSGSFYGILFNLSPQTTYYVRAFATNSEGTSYGQSLSFTTLPLININPFISSDVNGESYNVLLTRAERDALIQSRLYDDWVDEIPYSIEPWWVCENYASQLTTNCHNWGNDIRMKYSDYPDERLYNWYKGRNVDSIKLNGGTLVDMGKLGLPMGKVRLLVDTTQSVIGHEMNFVITGNDLRNWNDINFIEPQSNMINMKLSTVLPDCDEVTFSYPCTYQEGSRNYLKYINLIKYRITNGKPEIFWENRDSCYVIKFQRGS